MADGTGIEWTDATWNPIRGCSRVSEGCRNCYAETVAARFSGPGQAYEGLARRRTNGEPAWTGVVRLVEEHLTDPLRWQRPRRIFVNSMSDLFHESLDEAVIAQVFAVMALAPRHTFQVLTKRPRIMRELLSSGGFRELVSLMMYECATSSGAVDPNDRRCRDALATAPDVDGDDWPLPNVWFGVSVENQAAADERIPDLVRTPAAVRFLSCEPLLGPVRLSRFHQHCPEHDSPGGRCTSWHEGIQSIDWVIVGGESGARARPMHPDWARSLRDQCVDAGVPFFFKQHGEYREFDTGSLETIAIDAESPGAEAQLARAIAPAFVAGDGRVFASVDEIPEETPARLVERLGKKRSGRVLDGRTWDEMPAPAQVSA